MPRGVKTGPRGVAAGPRWRAGSKFRGANGQRPTRLMMVFEDGSEEPWCEEPGHLREPWSEEQEEGDEDSECEDEGEVEEDHHMWGRIWDEAKVEELRHEAPANRAYAVGEAVMQLKEAMVGPDYKLSGETLVELAVGKDMVECHGSLRKAFLEEEERDRSERFAVWLEECGEEWFRGGTGGERE